MAEYVRMPKAHYEAACNSIRAKTGKADKIKSGDMSSEIDSITTGGGSSDDVRYVTFMNHDGTVEYGKLPVAVGYDCPNPKFDDPTRESDVQFDYTFAGWATTVNGGLDSNALKSVTEDRTVYANFASVLRYYTITYYDGDTVLKTESLAYGSMPAYEAEKEGYGFGGWSPKLTIVTGVASYTAIWEEKITFANGSWSKIAEISEAGEAANYFAIGDTKSLTLSYSDGTTQSINVRIVGFNHDTLSDGTGKAGISIICSKARTSYYNFSENASYGNSYVWENSKTRVALNSGEVYNALPEELRSVIKTVTKTSNGGYSEDYGGKKKNILYTTNDKVWIPSSTELGLDSQVSASYTAHNQGSKYEYYGSTSTLTITGTNSYTINYSTRSMYTQTTHTTVGVNGKTGAINNNLYLNAVVIGFCI